MDINEIEHSDVASHLVWGGDYHYYVHTPSLVARNTFLYPLQTGLFHYEEGLLAERTRFDSFLIMVLRNGSMLIRTKDHETVASGGDFVLLDCYEYHYYQALEPSDVLWMHFDGKAARPYYEAIRERRGVAFALRNPVYALNQLARIYEIFKNGERLCEPVLGKYITDVLCEILAPENDADFGAADRDGEGVDRDGVRRVMAYIPQHLDETLSVGELAAIAYMGEYTFIRAFKAQTGYTPHAYVMQARFDAATYMLANAQTSLKEICEACGFSTTSVFCSAFRKRMGVSPLEYRRRARNVR
ncbi:MULTISPECIES: AraC family transcriptional regulator [Bifidobacterium]|uniref:AraC family transcriptional regulator n=1 Tax=Bifidobacterium TaxID=1678 RepID=UPI001BDBE372|nr:MULTISPECIES: AraC family transcriptional regulator [Bifidobacterium]MBT1161502.1 helix-turn-helix transcriptional regulator [Bifidobacterium sp. SO1]MBW3078878.1 helix-turn-helix transcriptional regulator [Bifidobacterium simiiventris]